MEGRTQMNRIDRITLPTRRPATTLTAILLSGVLVFVFVRLDLPLLEPEEALYAVVARDSLHKDQLLVPFLRGEPYLDKPPLLNWSVMACYHLFGEHVWSARLIPTLAAWLTIVTVFGWGVAVGDWGCGVAAAAVLMLTGDYLYRGPMLTPNGLLGLFTTAALALGHFSLRSERIRLRWWVASAGACGVAVLAKGPLALALVAVPLFAGPRLVRGLARPGFASAVIYLAGVAVVAAPWFVAVAVRHPEFADHFFWKHNVQRFFQPFDHSKPFFFYLPQVFVGGMPWSLIPFIALAEFAVGRNVASAKSGNAQFALLAAAIGLAFFSASGSKRAVYLVPLWPVYAFGIGVWFAPLLQDATAVLAGLSRRSWLCIGAATATALVAGVALWLPEYHRQFSAQDLIPLIASSGVDSPVYSYPRPCNSLDFYLGAGAVEAVQEADRKKLIEGLLAREKSFVVVMGATALEEFSAALPQNLVALEASKNRVAAALFVEHRSNASDRRSVPKSVPDRPR